MTITNVMHPVNTLYEGETLRVRRGPEEDQLMVDARLMGNWVTVGMSDLDRDYTKLGMAEELFCAARAILAEVDDGEEVTK